MRIKGVIALINLTLSPICHHGVTNEESKRLSVVMISKNVADVIEACLDSGTMG